ncbi:MAG: SRPBCC family protein [Pseudonocardia sp.]
MIKLLRTTIVNLPVDEVVTYLANFATTEEWDAGTVRTTRIGEGPVEVGARWHNVSEFRGKQTELEYTLVRYEPHRVTFSGGNKTVSTTDDITVEPDGDRTAIHYRAGFEFHGVAKLATPFVKGAIEKLGDDTIAQLTRVLNARGMP